MSDSKRPSDTIFKGADLQSLVDRVMTEKQYSKVFVLTDSNTKRHCLPLLPQKLDLGKQPIILEVPAGENNKDIKSCLGLWRELTNNQGDRSSLMINLGGGMITDLGGFVASTFKRGIDFINIPTSLLAMVDAAVGGKTGVDLDGLKNQIGVISNARGVVVDTDFLRTLPIREFYAGLAEMLKHGLIGSQKHWNDLADINPESKQLEGLIWDSIQIKKRITDLDPTEKGPRKALNFGHTVGHAIETHLLNTRPEEQQLLHGEAVGAGLIIETWLSSRILGLSPITRDEIIGRILPLFPKPHLAPHDIKAIIKLMSHDKKNRGGRTLFVLLQDIEKPKIDQSVPESAVFQAFEFYKNL